MKRYLLVVCEKCNEPIEDTECLVVMHQMEILFYHCHCSPVKMMSRYDGAALNPVLDISPTPASIMDKAQIATLFATPWA